VPNKRRAGARSGGGSVKSRLRLAIHALIAVAVIAGVFLYLVPKFDLTMGFGSPNVPAFVADLGSAP
jgi:hypothetical protein